ncbi:hypothetical protein [Agarilytica rhodophyticola]|uniref:hypothetical protein n=1 Tax=Agarilytica rhodophyticola TaxID=1737490 RepID=UPI000B34227C|nr:hypothetical protein [Agarilytica rhodophyticola]
MRTHVRFKTYKFKPPEDDGEPSTGEELAKWLLEKIDASFKLGYLDDNYYCILSLGQPINEKI